MIALDRIGLDPFVLGWMGLTCTKLILIGLDWAGLDWSDLNLIGLDLDGIGLDWMGWGGVE